MSPRPLSEVEDERLQERDPLAPNEEVSALLQAGFIAQREQRFSEASSLYQQALETARYNQDSPGEARAIAQRASMAETRGETESALRDAQDAAQLFLELGDGNGLVQTYRLEALIHLRLDDVVASAAGFARALGLALQLDSALVFTTLNQLFPAVRQLVETGRIADLLPIGAGIRAALEQVQDERGAWPEAIADVVEIVEAVAGILASLALMASEPEMDSERRRKLAARATHQAWMIDALTRRRWGLADLVKDTLTGSLDFHEELD